MNITIVLDVTPCSLLRMYRPLTAINNLIFPATITYQLQRCHLVRFFVLNDKLQGVSFTPVLNTARVTGYLGRCTLSICQSCSNQCGDKINTLYIQSQKYYLT
jgi:hypothetical protein